MSERGDAPSASLHIIVQPRASRTEIVGQHGDAIRIRLKAAPVEGAANDELVRYLAKRLGVPRSAVRLAHGVRGRSKRIAIDGVTTAEARARLLGASSVVE